MRSYVFFSLFLLFSASRCRFVFAAHIYIYVWAIATLRRHQLPNPPQSTLLGSVSHVSPHLGVGSEFAADLRGRAGLVTPSNRPDNLSLAGLTQSLSSFALSLRAHTYSCCAVPPFLAAATTSLRCSRCITTYAHIDARHRSVYRKATAQGAVYTRVRPPPVPPTPGLISYSAEYAARVAQ